MLAKVMSAQMSGLSADIIDVEVDISQGLHSFSIVGLPDKAVEESKDRITAAIKNSGFKSPQKGNAKVIVSLSPADLKKEGSSFDLAIALAHLLATRELSFNPKGKPFFGRPSLGENPGALARPFLTGPPREGGRLQRALPAARECARGR